MSGSVWLNASKVNELRRSHSMPGTEKSMTQGGNCSRHMALVYLKRVDIRGNQHTLASENAFRILKTDYLQEAFIFIFNVFSIDSSEEFAFSLRHQISEVCVIS